VFNSGCAVSLLIREKRQELRSGAFQSYRIGRVVENLDAVGVEDPGEGEIGSQLVEWGSNQQGVGEPDPYLRKQEGLRIILEKTYGGDVMGESQNFRSPDNEKHS